MNPIIGGGPPNHSNRIPPGRAEEPGSQLSQEQMSKLLGALVQVLNEMQNHNQTADAAKTLPPPQGNDTQGDMTELLQLILQMLMQMLDPEGQSGAGSDQGGGRAGQSGAMSEGPGGQGDAPQLSNDSIESLLEALKPLQKGLGSPEGVDQLIDKLEQLKTEGTQHAGQGDVSMKTLVEELISALTTLLGQQGGSSRQESGNPLQPPDGTVNFGNPGKSPLPLSLQY